MTQLFEAMVNFFTTDQWPFVQLEETPTLRMGFQGDNGNWICYASVRDDLGYFFFYSICPVNVPPDKRQVMAEFLTRANYGLTIGNFEMDFNDGEIRYKTSVDTENEPPSETMLRNLVYANVFNMDRYLPGIMSVIYSDVSPVEAVVQIESDGTPDTTVQNSSE